MQVQRSSAPGNRIHSTASKPTIESPLPSRGVQLIGEHLVKPVRLSEHDDVEVGPKVRQLAERLCDHELYVMCPAHSGNLPGKLEHPADPPPFRGDRRSECRGDFDALSCQPFRRTKEHAVGQSESQQEVPTPPGDLGGQPGIVEQESQQDAAKGFLGFGSDARASSVKLCERGPRLESQ
jgi:hypothetical protein